MLDLLGAIEEVGALRDVPGRQAGHASASVARLTAEILTCARNDPQSLAQDLENALLDISCRLDRVSLAVTGLGWLGSGAPSVEQEMIALVRGARREIALCAYSVTPGALSFLSEMKEVVSQGVIATLIVNRFATQSPEVQLYMKEAARTCDRWHLYDFAPAGAQTELHAKVLVVDRSRALLGSANLSFHGMISNHEMAVVLRGPTAEAISLRIDMLKQWSTVRLVPV
jgi:cardiolipin synthase